MANGCLDMASISRSQIALPNAQSGLWSEDDLSTDRIASDLPGPLGTRMRRSLILRPIVPFSTATSAARMRFCGMPKLVGGDCPGKIGVAGLLYYFFLQSAVDGDHFSADDIFGYFSRFIVGIALACPLHDVVRHEALIQFPGEEAFSGVSGPERAVAVERGDARFEGEYTFDEFGLNRRERRHEIWGLSGN